MFDILLLISAAILVLRSSSETDDVWALCLRALAVVATLTVATGERGLPLVVGLLGLALWLPSANRAERQLEEQQQSDWRRNRGDHG
ncbi:MAG: hypothetical protein VKK62_07370 [Synechococcaceae cyanobacterium]|nr:hypothetical protein [Synechococcaceae cyanobacterium]